MISRMCVLSYFSRSRMSMCLTVLRLFLKKLINYLIYGCVVSSFLCAGFGCSEQGLLSIVVHGLLIGWPLLLRSVSSRHAGFSSCGMRAQELWLAGSRAQAQ